MKFDLTKYEIKKNIILNATYKCIFRQGIAGLSMRSIASLLSQNSLYPKTISCFIPLSVHFPLNRYILRSWRIILKSDQMTILCSCKRNLPQPKIALVLSDSYITIW